MSVVRHPHTISSCPSIDALSVFAAGGGTERGNLVLHLDRCVDCRRAVATAARTSSIEIARGSVATFEVEDGDEPHESTLSTTGLRIGRYVVRRVLGQGAMGVVHLAYDPELRRHVALKVMKPEAEDRDATRLFVEAQAAAQLIHPNTVTVFDVGVHEGHPYVAMEYVDGVTLAQWLRRSPSWRDAFDVICRAGDGLWAAHRAGLVHRDFKLGNILLGPDRTVKVSDFGLARFADETLRAIAAHEQGLELPASPRAQTSAGVLVGTPAYTSPEQYAGSSATEASDQFAFGVAVYRVLYGVRPFRGPTLYAVYDAICHEAPPPPPADADVPASLWPIVSRALSKDPRARFASMGELLSALREAAEASSNPVERCPYPGLVSFDQQDACIYFGRSRELAEVGGRLRDHAIAAVIGPSGSGKSSFVRALVVPTLRQSDPGCDVITIRPGANPLHALARALTPIVERDPDADVDELAAWIRREPRRAIGLLLSHARRCTGTVIVVIDQLEELYTQCRDLDERRAFALVLAAMVAEPERPLRLIVTLRSDFVDRVAECGPLMDRISDGFLFMGPPTRVALIDALVKPLERVGYEFEELSIAAQIAAHLEGQPGAFPLLQFVAGQLWEARDVESKRITRASVTAIGSVAGALAAHADQLLARLTTVEVAVARRILVRLVTTERTRTQVATSALASLAKNPAELTRVVDQLVRGRLLVADGTTIELAHETLISMWPTLRGWLDDEAGDARIVSELVAAARRWDLAGRSDGYLWSGEPARRAIDLARRSTELAEVELAFVAATRKMVLRGARRARLLVIAALVIATTIAAVASVGFWMVREAKQSAEINAELARSEQARAVHAAAELQSKLDELHESHERIDELEGSNEDLERRRRIDAEAANRLLRETNEALETKNTALDDALRREGRAREQLESTTTDLRLQVTQNRALLRERDELVRRLENENHQLRRRKLPAAGMSTTREEP
ncbi:MAG: protein kinase domain-containing protein [Kofleriaceae bacterium]